MADGNDDTFVIFAGVYSDVTNATADYEAVKDLYYATNLIDTFDAAIIGKTEEDNVRPAITQADEVLARQPQIDADYLANELEEAKGDGG